MHGGNIYDHEKKYGRRPIDFSASLNPYGMNDYVKNAAKAAVDECDMYPDDECTSLREAIAEYHNYILKNHPGKKSAQSISPDMILCGNGSSDLIYRLACALRPKKALIPVPAFSEYAQALSLYDCDLIEYPLKSDNDFIPDHGFVDAITDDIDLVILTIPHNPTGTVPDKKLTSDILKKCDESSALLLCDECFMEFLKDDKNISLINEINSHDLIILRAFTKYHGMAGLRLGYCMTKDTDLLYKMKHSGPPWPVSTIAQKAGIAAIKNAATETDDSKKLHNLIDAEREYLTNKLSSLGCHVIPSRANFILFYFKDTTLCKKLLSRDILIRDCRDFTGLAPGWYRIAIKTHDKNELLINALSELAATPPE